MRSWIVACAAAGSFVLAVAPVARAQILFVPDYSPDGPAEGFNDPTATTVNGVPTTLGLARRSAFQQALTLTGNLFSPRYVGETVVVQAAFNPLGGTMTGATLGSAGATNFQRDFAGAPLASTFYPQPLANHRAGSDLNGVSPEISIQFNSDVDNSTVLGPISWYYGTNRMPGSNVDLITTAMHEIGHGLGFSSFLLSNGDYNGGFPAAWDRFTNTSSTGGTKLPALTAVQRQGERIGNDLWWDGPLGTAGNSGTRPRLYAPNPFEGGSSLSHTDETTHGPDLMSPSQTTATADFSAMNIGMLRDMGWTPIPEPSSFLLVGAIAACGTAIRRRRAKQAAAA